MPSLAHPVRKIVFTIESRDQGWGGGDSRGSYHGSWTWFEAGLERFDPSAPCKYRLFDDTDIMFPSR